VTLCKREYGLDNETVKFLIGHDPSSDVMQTTYAHLSGEDHKEKAEVAAGLRDEDEESSLTPDHCKVCDEPLAPYAKVCPRCETEYSPATRKVEELFNNAVYESKGGTEDEQMEDEIDRLHRLMRTQPELILNEINLDELPDDSLDEVGT